MRGCVCEQQCTDNALIAWVPRLGVAVGEETPSYGGPQRSRSGGRCESSGTGARWLAHDRTIQGRRRAWGAWRFVVVRVRYVRERCGAELAAGGERSHVYCVRAGSGAMLLHDCASAGMRAMFWATHAGPTAGGSSSRSIAPPPGSRSWMSRRIKCPSRRSGSFGAVA